MRGVLGIIDNGEIERTLRGFNCRYDVKLIEDIEYDIDKQIEEIDLIIINIEYCNRSNIRVSSKFIENISNKNIPIILISDNNIDSEILMNECVVDLMGSDYNARFLLKKIDLFMRLSKVSEKVQGMEYHQYVMIKSLVELVECRDLTTGGHIKRTGMYMSILLESMLEEKIYTEELTSNYIKGLTIAAPLHDVGKIGINDATLRKSSPLDENEFELMKQHATLGGIAIQKIITEVGDLEFLIIAKEMAETHHENWDGTGYPNKLEGEEIPLCGRIMAIVDVYDALTAVRPYKKAMNHDEAVHMICTTMKSKFDPRILEVFKKHNERFEKLKDKK